MFKMQKTVSSIVASFEKMLSDLDEVKQRENDKVAQLNIELKQLELSRQESIQEAARAEKVAKKISALIAE